MTCSTLFDTPNIPHLRSNKTSNNGSHGQCPCDVPCRQVARLKATHTSPSFTSTRNMLRTTSNSCCGRYFYSFHLRLGWSSTSSALGRSRSRVLLYMLLMQHGWQALNVHLCKLQNRAVESRLYMSFRFLMKSSSRDKRLETQSSSNNR